MAKWYHTDVRYKQDKVVVKLYDDDGKFTTSVIVPTVMYPLNGPYQFFTAENTSLAGEEMFEAIDRVSYQVGHCYTNTQNVVKELRKAGFNAVPYAGWLFTNEGTPIHHCWAVVNEKIVIDLSDDQTVMRMGFPEDGSVTKDNVYEFFADFTRVTSKWPNSKRCYPMGQPFPLWLYIGCPCEPEDAVRIWKQLLVQFPNHECRRDSYPGNRSKLQWYLHEKGLI